MSIEIKPYTPDDHAEIWALHLKTMNENREGFVQNLAFHSDFEDIPLSYQGFFVMRENQKLIGMIGLKIEGDQGEIKRLQVDSDYQKRGYGRQLVEHLIAYAKDRGIKSIVLDHSEPLKKAHDLYLSLGFEVTHTQTRFLGPDQQQFFSYYMKKSLTS